MWLYFPFEELSKAEVVAVNGADEQAEFMQSLLRRYGTRHDLVGSSETLRLVLQLQGFCCCLSPIIIFGLRPRAGTISVLRNADADP